MTPLAGQAALVTGGSSGIGAGVVRALAAAGARVAINYHSGEAEAEAIAREVRAGGGEVLTVQADVSSEPDVERAVAATVRAFGRLDVLVANSGVQQDAAFAEMTLDQWNAVVGLNLTGCFLCARAAVRQFRAQPARSDLSRARGKILFMSSVHERIPWAGHANYAAAKGGVMLLMRTLAQEVAAERIRVNGIAPGAIRTPINQEAWDTPEALAQLLRLVPYGRIGEPEDVGRAAVWLASDDSDYVTGHSLFVDGGMSLYPGFRDNG